MNAGYLLDTNHLSRAVTPRSSVRQRITALRQRGIKVGTCVPVLCEIEAGIQQVSQPDVYRLNLERLLRQDLVWPIDPSTATIYGAIHHNLQTAGSRACASGHDGCRLGPTDGADFGPGLRRAARQRDRGLNSDQPVTRTRWGRCDES